MPRKPLKKYLSTCICHSLNLVKSNDNQTRMCLSTPFGKIR